jgi:hypothetical protein
MSNTGKVNWTAIGVFGTFAAVAVGLLVWWQTERKNQEEKAQQPARLVTPATQPAPGGGVIPADEYVPPGPNLPTLISFRNDGRQEAIIKQVILSGWQWKPTPKRQNVVGAGKAIRVAFERRHYVKETGQYNLVLKTPGSAPGGGQWTTLEVALVDPPCVGYTFVGTVTVVFDGLEQKQFKDVQIDVLKEAPRQD